MKDILKGESKKPLLDYVKRKGLVGDSEIDLGR